MHVPQGSLPAAAALYQRLRAANPAPFAALVQWDGVAIVSSSPERLVRVNGRHIDTRPIAGTRPRSRRPGDDARRCRSSPHTPRSAPSTSCSSIWSATIWGGCARRARVRVDELMSIESYTHVHHIVSNVSGVLRAEVTPVGALRAVFPGGTITGVPKFRCMQIIAELEGAGRGAYTGSLGYLTTDGRLDLNILIRTMTLSGEQLDLPRRRGHRRRLGPAARARGNARQGARAAGSPREPAVNLRRRRRARAGERPGLRLGLGARARPALRGWPVRDHRLHRRAARGFSRCT